MKRQLLLLSTVLLSYTGSIWAQQDKLITHFIYDKMSINPGETGIDEGICGALIYRNQWDRVNGAPNSAVLNIEANLMRYKIGGVGVSFYHDAIGFNRQNNLLLNYSYPLDVAGMGTLGIGVGVGMINFGYDPTWVPPTTSFDQSLPAGFAATNLDLNAGLYFKSNSTWYAGISTTHLNETLLRQEIGTIAHEYQTARHYYIMGGNMFENVVTNGDIDVQALVRTDLNKVSADINARFIYNNMFYGGLTYRNVDAIGVMLGYHPMQNMTIGYSYDVTTNKLAGVSRGSHELVFKYCYMLPPIPVQKTKHPRWL